MALAPTVLGNVQIDGLPDATLPVAGTEYLHMRQGTKDVKVKVTDAMYPHINDKGNPHDVTKDQVKLGNVTNDAQLKIASNLADLADKIAARTNLEVYSKTESDTIFVPQTRKINGHDLKQDLNLVPADIGLGNVPNYAKSDDYREDADKLASSRAVSALYRAIQAEHPVGTIIPTLTDVDPGTYLLCGGTWQKIGQGCAMVGFDPNQPGRTVGSTFGAANKQITTQNLPKHFHTVTLTGGNHVHRVLGNTVGAGGHAHNVSGQTSGYDHGTVNGSTGGGGNHAHNGVTDIGGNHRHEYCGDDNLPALWGIARYNVARYDADSDDGGWAKSYWTGWEGQHQHSFNTSWSGDHAHSVSVPIGAHSHTFSGTAAQVADHLHGIDFNSQNASHTHSGQTDSAGGDVAFNVEQPSIVVYLWARTQ